MKISDFGLSRDIYAVDYYKVQSKSLLPVSPDSLVSEMTGSFFLLVQLCPCCRFGGCLRKVLCTGSLRRSLTCGRSVSSCGRSTPTDCSHTTVTVIRRSLKWSGQDNYYHAQKTVPQECKHLSCRSCLKVN